MKKIYQTAKWKRFSRNRQEDELNRRKERQKRLKLKRKQELGLSAPRLKEKRSRIQKVTVLAPESFSFIKHPQEMITFFNMISDVSQKRIVKKQGKKQRRVVRRTRIYIDMANVKSLTPDAIPALVSLVASKKKAPGISFEGNVPDDPNLRDVFIQSGFYRHVRSGAKPSLSEQGSIRERRSYIVEPDTAKELITFATEKLYGRKVRKQGVVRALIECMSNTRNHADPTETHFEPWWASVYFKSEERKACFTFIDTGVGVFESLRIKGFLESLARIFRVRDNRDILREILKGNIGSRTGLPYRGKGLPSIQEVLNKGLISNLIIISNDVYANIEKSDFKLLRSPFRGTLIYWELSDDN